jgi:hypothetical protein
MSNATELEIVRNAVSLPGATITRNALIIDPNASDEQLAQIGEALVQIEGSRSWWIGDYGVMLQSRKGEHYTEGNAEALGIEPGSFHQYKSVAAFFKVCTRVQALSFKHHYEAMCGCDGDVAVAQDWLDQAAGNEWSVSELRKAIRSSRADYKADGLKPTGNGYSAITDADRWAGSKLTEAQDYTAEQASAILLDIERLLAFVDVLRKRAKLGVV